MEITLRTVDGIAVLDVKGKITVGPGGRLLGETIGGLLASGSRELILNYAEVPYIDSLGLQETARAYMTVSRVGGRVVYCNFSKRLLDLLSITKLLTVFEVADSVELAAALMRSDSLVSSCPVCGPVARVRIRVLSSDEQQVCPRCEVSFRADWPRSVSATGSGGAMTGQGVTCSVLDLRFVTYKNEHVLVTPGRPFLVTVNGRLDLFAFDRVERAWNAIPAPRLAVFTVGEVTATGLAKLVALCSRSTDGSEGRIVGPKDLDAGTDDQGRAVQVYDDIQSALDTLGHIESMGSSLSVTLRQSDSSSAQQPEQITVTVAA